MHFNHEEMKKLMVDINDTYEKEYLAYRDAIRKVYNLDIDPIVKDEIMTGLREKADFWKR